MSELGHHMHVLMRDAIRDDVGVDDVLLTIHDILLLVLRGDHSGGGSSLSVHVTLRHTLRYHKDTYTTTLGISGVAGSRFGPLPSLHFLTILLPCHALTTTIYVFIFSVVCGGCFAVSEAVVLSRQPPGTIKLQVEPTP